VDPLPPVMNGWGGTTLARAGYIVQFARGFKAPPTLALAQLFNPELSLASHHDELISSIDGTHPLILPDMATEPLYTAVREVMPETQTLSPIYRTPLVINTRNGKFTLG